MSFVFIVLKDGKSVFGVFSNEKAAKAAADKMNKDIDKHKYTVEKHEVWEETMIEIHKSPTADSRTCDYTQVSKDQLLASSIQHIGDIRKGFEFFIGMMKAQAERHDLSKITHIDDFHRNFVTRFKETDWWEHHQDVERHHFANPKYIPEDVNLIDIIDQVIDGVMAGMARSGVYREEPMSPELLERAYRNTIKILLANVQVVES